MSARWFVLVAFVTLAVVAVLTAALRQPSRTTKVERPQTVVVVPQDLHDSGPVAARRTPLPTKRAKRLAPTMTISAPQTKSQKRNNPPAARIRPSTPSRRKKTTGKTRKPSAGSGSGSPAAPAPPAQPAPRKPLVGVTVPAPVTVCAHPLATVNC